MSFTLVSTITIGLLAFGWPHKGASNLIAKAALGLLAIWGIVVIL